MALHDEDAVDSGVELGVVALPGVGLGALLLVVVLVLALAGQQVELSVLLEPLPGSLEVAESEAAYDFILVVILQP